MNVHSFFSVLQRKKKKPVLLSCQHQYCCLDSGQKNKEKFWNCFMICKTNTRTQFLEANQAVSWFSYREQIKQIKKQTCACFWLFQTCKGSSTLHEYHKSVCNTDPQDWHPDPNGADPIYTVLLLTLSNMLCLIWAAPTAGVLEWKSLFHFAKAAAG